MKNIKKHRDFAKYTRQRLERARGLYVRFCRGAIAKDRTTDTLNYCAKRMMMSGMYSTIHWKSLRYSILRRMWKFDHLMRLNWFEWTTRNGWQAHSWTRVPIERCNWSRRQMEDMHSYPKLQLNF